MKWLILAATVLALGACTSPEVTINSFNGSTGQRATSGGRGSVGSTGGSTGRSSAGRSSGGATSSGRPTGGGANCNPACGANARCDGGVCRCIAGTSNCQAEDGGLNCVDELTDNANCFECGNACGMTQTCVDGRCGCAEGKTLCDSFCDDTQQDPSNCGTCANLCGSSYAMDSICRDGVCACGDAGHICAALPASSPPTCFCSGSGSLCPSPSFATDVYPLLAQQSGAFGCAASGCHSGARPAGALGFRDEGGEMDAGMAYAELLGLDGGGGGSAGFPGCDAGLPVGAPSTQCACVSRAVAGYAGESYLVDVLMNDLPAGCGMDSPMPVGRDGDWVPLDACAQQLVKQWVAAGAGE